MKVEKLLRYGIPEGVIESWRKNLAEELLPLQALAVAKYELLNGQSLIISAPTSSGKTFCGEMASVANLFKRKKVIYLVPLKAIAEEKFSDFVEKYSDLGIKVVISTKDRQEHDRKIEKSDFDLAIMIYEKFNQLLLRNMDILSQVNLIIVDELQMIADPSRGPVLELALLKIRTSKYRPQILGLSAVLKDVDELSSWLGCKLLLEKSRPVELLQGILLDGKLFYRKHNSKEEGIEELVGLDSEEAHPILFANVEKLVKDGEQVLVFLKSKLDSENCASLFSEKVNFPSCLNTIEVLSDLENTTLKQKLIECLQKGVAFHNADLTFDERRIVEHFYLLGEIRVIFSTTTLSMGVNLPAKTVFIEAQKYQLGEYSDKTVMTPISLSEYENMSGRAGRLGLEKDFGRSILIAFNKFHFDSLWEGYIEGESAIGRSAFSGEEKIVFQLDKKNVEDIILDLITSGVAKNMSQLKQVIQSTPSGKSILGKEIFLDERVEELIQNKLLLTTDNGNTLFASKLGALCARKGISVQTGLDLKKKLEGTPPPLAGFPMDFDPFSWFYDILDTKDGEEIYINVFFFEEENRMYEEALAQRYYQNQTINQRIKGLLERKVGFSHKENQLVKLSFLLSDWITHQSTLDLENKYLCRSGQIEQIGKKAGWLLDAACGIARVLNLNHKFSPPLTGGGKGEDDIVRFLKNLSQKVNFGVDQRGLKLAKLRVPSLGRDYIWSLVENGFSDPNRIKETELSDLEKFIPIRAAERLKHKIQNFRRTHGTKFEIQNSTFSVEKDRTQSSKIDGLDLVIDGSAVKDKFLVLVNGKRVNLPAKSFKYLVKLTWALFKNDGGWIHKNDFEPGENQTRYLHRLKKQIKPCLDLRQVFFENNRLGSYRLNMTKQRIKLNQDALLKNPDAEIKKMAEELSAD
jgi:helicase